MATLGEAAVEIIAETGDFDDDLRRRLQRTVDESSREMQDDLRRVQRQAEQTGRSLREEVGEGAGRASRDIERLERVSRAAERAIEDMDPEALRRVADQAARSRSEMQEMVRAARAGEGPFARMDPEKLERIARAADEAQADMDRLARQTRRTASQIEEFGDSDNIERLAMDLERARRQAERLDQTRLTRLRGEARTAGRAIWRAFTHNSQGARRDLERIDDVRFREVVRRAQRAADQIGRAFRRAGDSEHLTRGLSRAGKTFGVLLAGGAALAALTGAAAGLVSIVSALVAVLAPSLGLLAGIPAAAMLGAGAFATLKVALSGVGEAFSAALAGGEGLEEALEDLAPAARKVVREVAEIAPQLDTLRQSVQGAFFRPLIGEITAVAGNLLGPLRRGMTAAAAELGRLASGVTRFGRSAEAVALVEETFGQLAAQLGGIGTDTISGLLGAFSRFVRATLPGFDSLGASIDGALSRLSRFLDRAAASGDALRWLETGKAGARALGALLADLGRITVGVGRAMQAASDGALGSLGRLADDLAAFVGSAQGQAQLVEVFTAINAVAAQTGPVIRALVAGLASLSPTLAVLAAELGPTLVAAVNALVPALQGLLDGLEPVFTRLREAITGIEASGALGALGRGLGALMAAAAPLLPAIGDVLVSAMWSLAAAAQAVAPLLHLVASALAAIASSPAGAVLGPLVAQLLLVRLVTGSWATALKSLVSVLKVVGRAAMWFGRALIGLVIANPVVAVIVGLVAALALLLSRVEAVREAVGRFTGALSDGFSRLREFGAALLTTFRTEGPAAALRQLGSGIISGLSAALRGAAALVPRLMRAVLGGIASALEAVPRQFAALGTAVTAGLRRLGTVVPQVARALAEGLRGAWASLREQGPLIGRALAAAVRDSVAALRTEGPRIAAAVGDLVRGAFSALVTYGPTLARQAGEAFNELNTSLVRMARDGLRRAGDALAANLPGLAARIAEVVSNLIRAAGERLPEIFDQLAERVRTGLDQSLSNAASGAGAGGGQLRQSLVDLLLDLGAELARQAVALAPVIAQAVNHIALEIGKALVAAAPHIIMSLGDLLLTLGGALLVELGSFLASLPGRLLAALTPLDESLGQRGGQAMRRLLTGMMGQLPSLLTWLMGLPMRLAAALNPFPSLMGSRAGQAMARLRERLASGGISAAGVLRPLPNNLSALLAPLAPLMGSRAGQAMTRLASRLRSGGPAAGAAMKSALQRAASAARGFSSTMAGIGANLMSSFVSGVRSRAGAIASAVVAPIRNAIAQARSVLSIGSPSKVFMDIGKFVGQGFIKGMTGQAPDIKKTADKLVSLITKAFKGKKTRTDDKLIAYVKKQNKQLQKMAKAREKIAETIKAANDKAAEITRAAGDFASLSGAAGALGTDVPLSAEALARQMRERLEVLRRFRADLAALARRGLSDDLIAQLVEAGPERGAELARALAAGSNTTIAELNRTAEQIAAASKGLGRDAADLLYDSGIAAGKGFLAGLKAQEDDITKLMTRLAQQVAATVKKTLKIRSPSRVMRGLGADTVAGYLAGLERLAPQIEETMRAALDEALAGAAARARMPLPRPAAPDAGPVGREGLGPVPRAPRRRFGDGWHTRPQVVRNTTVNAPVNLTVPVPDPELAARVVAKRITEKATQ